MQIYRQLLPKQWSDKHCPKCDGGLYREVTFNAVSRLDGTTAICTDCGIGEAHGQLYFKWKNRKAMNKALARRVAFKLTQGG